MTGTLYIVATPIGNLEDITHRALRVLKEVGWIASEDTRQTRKLLDHFGITTPQLSYHEHNERERATQLIEKLTAGINIALVSDAGTPLISDPGYRLVREAIEAGITVVPLPGPSAAVAALSASGLATDQFRFCGFLPAKTTQRRKVLEELKHETCTLIFYETPHRIIEALADIDATLGARQVVVAREVTKMHEEFLRGTAAEVMEVLSARPSVKGEITLMIGRSTVPAVSAVPLPQAVRALESAGMARMDAIKQIARERGLPKREVYRSMEET